MSLSIFILLGLVSTIIGALPFGLVNLTVPEGAYHKGKRLAMNIAHGASWIDVLFGLTAILVGNTIMFFCNSSLKYLPLR